jgi:iron complex transport system ATP-binding protein
MVEEIRTHSPLAGPELRERPLLEIVDLTFGYAGQTLLTAVQMQVQRGEMVGLLGPNGSGKTTLLRLLSGLLRPWQGQIVLDGRDLASLSRRALARRVAVVPQEFQVPFAFTVEQMVALGRTPFINLFGTRSRRDHEIVRDALQLAEVTDLAGRIFNELSGGERQRVLLAMALAQQPDLLLLDEPTAHLDIKYQIEMLELVARLKRETGITLVAALHDLNLAARYFPRLVLFQRAIVADGGPAAVLDPALLKRVYGVTVQVGVMPGSQYLSVQPPDKQQALSPAPGFPPIHVMAGGGSGTLLMRALADADMAFSAGVFSLGDSDYTLALHLADSVLAESPFAPISRTTRQSLRERLASSSLLIICPLPFGPGNLALLQEALTARQHGLPVLLLLPDNPVVSAAENHPASTLSLTLPGWSRLDYTDGEGERLLKSLLEADAIVICNSGAALEFARNLPTCASST